MRTEYLAVDAADPEPGVIARAARAINEGGLVAFPTETVYGLGADATWSRAVLRIFEAKERARDDPLIVHVADARQAEEVAVAVPLLARRLGERFWPGALTLVLERGPLIAPEVSAGRATVAVRVPSHPVAKALIRAAGVPIAAPSANRFTRTSATTAAHVREDLDGRIDVVLDGGPATAGIESTVVAFDGDDIRILRPGAVTAEALAEALRATGAGEVAAGGGATGASPGTMARHYSPRTPLVYVAGDPERTAGRTRRTVVDALATGQTIGVLAADEDAEWLRSTGARVVVAELGSADDVEAIARRLFAALRELDGRGVDAIYARAIGRGGLWTAIDDRLRRAADRVLEE